MLIWIWLHVFSLLLCSQQWTGIGITWGKEWSEHELRALRHRLAKNDSMTTINRNRCLQRSLKLDETNGDPIFICPLKIEEKQWGNRVGEYFEVMVLINDSNRVLHHALSSSRRSRALILLECTLSISPPHSVTTLCITPFRKCFETIIPAITLFLLLQRFA